eukprot:9430815-Pyramimonas_sp.AAC.1
MHRVHGSTSNGGSDLGVQPIDIYMAVVISSHDILPYNDRVGIFYMYSSLSHGRTNKLRDDDDMMTLVCDDDMMMPLA